MKQLATLVVLALVLLPAALALEQNLTTEDSFIAGGAYPVAVSVRYEPHPVQPGQYFDVWLTIENRGGRVAENVVVEMIPEYPFSVDDPGSERVRIGTLQSLQRSQARFTVRVDERAVEGSSALDFEVEHSTGIQSTPARVVVDIRPLDFLLAFQNVKTTPAPVPQGSEFTISGKLVNLGSTPVRSVKASLVLPSTNLFVPVGEASQRVISFLAGGESRDISFNLVTDPAAASGPVVLPLRLEFFDLNGNPINQSQNVGVVVGSQPVLTVLVDTTTITRESPSGEVVLKFINRGLEDIKFMHAKVQSTPEVSLISGEEFYIGKIDSDDFETAELRISVEDSSKDRVMIPVSLEYFDANNNKYTEGLSIPLRVHTNKELGQGGGSGWLVVVIILVVAGLGYYLYRRRKARKR